MTEPCNAVLKVVFSDTGPQEIKCYLDKGHKGMHHGEAKYGSIHYWPNKQSNSSKPTTEELK